MAALSRHRVSYRTVYLYIAREFLLSFFVAFLFFFSIFFINQLLLLAEDILSKNVAFIDVALLVIYSLPAIITFTFPFSSLVGALMAAGRLSGDNEILAFRAAGISYRRLFVPFIVVGLAFSIFSFIAGDYFLPRGTIAFGRLYRDILYRNPSLELESYSVHHYNDASIITGRVSEKGIEDLVIIDTTAAGEKRVLVADKAELKKSGEQEGVISLILDSVRGHTAAPKKRGEYDYFSASHMEYNLLLKDITVSISSLSPREMSSVDVYKAIEEKREKLARRKQEHRREAARREYSLLQDYYGPSPNIHSLVERLTSLDSFKNRPIRDRSLNMHLIEFHKKIAIPFGCLAFVFFAFPLGGVAGRSGKSVGFGIGLIVSVFYWALLFAGQTLGLRFSFNPVLSMWIPNILIFLVGIILYRVRGRV